jgi:hypothetical protein
MDYINYLRDEYDATNNIIEVLLNKYKVQPVGNGYIDLIVSNELIEAFLNELTNNYIIIKGVTWWCHCTRESKLLFGCPHGMGGPESRYYDGWFSETQIPMYEIPNQVLVGIGLSGLEDKAKLINGEILRFIKNEFKNDQSYLECLVPALWLYVPKEWKRRCC